MRTVKNKQDLQLFVNNTLWLQNESCVIIYIAIL